MVVATGKRREIANVAYKKRLPYFQWPLCLVICAKHL